MLGLLILEDARKEEKAELAWQQVSFLWGSGCLGCSCKQTAAVTVIIKYISKKEFKGFSKNKHLKSTGLNSV